MSDGRFIVFILASAIASHATAYEIRTSGDPWHASVDPVPDDVGATGGWVNAVVLRFPGGTESQPGQFAAVTTRISIPAQGLAELSFRLIDTFTGPTAGYHFVEILVGDKPIFEEDVAGGYKEPREIQLNLRSHMPNGGEADLTIRLIDRKRVTNFSVVVHLVDPTLRTTKGQTPLFPLKDIASPQPLPPDLPLPSLPLADVTWTRTARILQPWGRTQHDAIVHAATRAPQLAKDYGFDAMIVLPPDAHNAITNDTLHTTTEQFDAALRAFRAEGFHVILYTSIMHCGHDPIWQHGQLAREHPDWSQRGPNGKPVTIYGSEWLCPSTNGLGFTIDYTRKLVERYAPDGVMLDNNQFMYTDSGLTCYCDACQAGFADYMHQRFGRRALGQPTDNIRIPTGPGPLYSVWLHWRNRVWARATEQFRIELRKVKPDIVVSANTQYLYRTATLATDLQYAHEDAVLSESRGMDTDRMIDKLLLGKALARDRPLWNYLGTFQEKDFERVVPPSDVAMNVSTAFGAGARPWVVYYGFYEHPNDNRASLERMASTLQWHRRHDPAARDLKPYAPVRSLVSLTSRNLVGSSTIPKHLTPLRHRGITSRIIEERVLTSSGLDDCRALIIEDAPCLSMVSINAVIAFVKGGGRLLTQTSTGLYDEIGRPRPRSPLWESLGHEQVIAMSPARQVDELAQHLAFAQFTMQPPTTASILPYVDQNGDLVVYVCSADPIPTDLRISAPQGAKGSAILCSPDWSEPRIRPLVPSR